MCLEKLDLVSLILRISNPSCDFNVLCYTFQQYGCKQDLKKFLQEMMKSELVSSTCNINGYQYRITVKGSDFLSLYDELFQQTLPKKRGMINSLMTSLNFFSYILQHLKILTNKNL